MKDNLIYFKKVRPRSAVERLLFYDCQFLPEDVCEMWGMSKKELIEVMEEPLYNMTMDKVMDVAVLTGVKVSEIVKMCGGKRPKDLVKVWELENKKATKVN